MSSLIPPLKLTGHLGTDTRPGPLGQHMGQEAWLKGETGAQNSWRPGRGAACGPWQSQSRCEIDEVGQQSPKQGLCDQARILAGTGS